MTNQALFTPKRPIILASQSPQRKMLLEAAGVEFTVLPAHINEQAIRHPDVKILTQRVAEAKAKAVNTPTNALILAADTVVSAGDHILEKPPTKQAAKAMLQKLSGSWMETITGLVWSVPELNVFESEAVVSRALFRQLSEQEIEYYVAHHQVTTWCGGFSPAYAAGANLLEKIDGSLTSFTHGLPMERVFPILEQYAA